MQNPRLVVKGMDRPNIWLGVEPYHDELTKEQALLQRIREAKKPGIVYVATRKEAERLAHSLLEQGVEAIFYHGGLKAQDREQAQQTFMADGAEVIVATIAFGMGIDKPNVRFVFHYQISASLEAYYQEIGRAGRDGKEAKARLFYRPQDLGLRRFFAGAGQLDMDEVEAIVEAVEKHPGPVPVEALGEQTNLSAVKLARALDSLEKVGATERLNTGEIVQGGTYASPSEVAEEAVAVLETWQQFEESRLEMMRGYAEVRDCRRKYLLNYFGEECQALCGNCDNCAAGVVVEADPRRQPFPLNSRVSHSEWGEGLVQRYEGDKIVILFDSVGYKTLATDLVLGRGLLQPAS